MFPQYTEVVRDSKLPWYLPRVALRLTNTSRIYVNQNLFPEMASWMHPSGPPPDPPVKKEEEEPKVKKEEE